LNNESILIVDGMKNRKVLITGGTGSFGHAFVRTILKSDVGRVLVFSRDEQKHEAMQAEFPDDRLRFFIGDVRDLPRLRRACAGVDILIHAAALKIVPIGEYNPSEAIKTNVMGAMNVVDAALDMGIEKVVGLSSDKSVSAVNLYGATKACAEKLFIQGNSYSGASKTRFACVRYGNVAGSRGSVQLLWKKQREHGQITITDANMTRFWMTIDEAVSLVLKALQKMKGGEVFIPILPSMRIGDLAEAMAPDCAQVITGIRPGEKLSECLLSIDEARHSIRKDGHLIILPEHQFWAAGYEGEPLPEGFSYSSDTNDRFLTVEELRGMV